MILLGVLFGGIVLLFSDGVSRLGFHFLVALYGTALYPTNN
jgi:hypothetical protein